MLTTSVLTSVDCAALKLPADLSAQCGLYKCDVIETANKVKSSMQ